MTKDFGEKMNFAKIMKNKWAVSAAIVGTAVLAYGLSKVVTVRDMKGEVNND